MYRTVRVMRQAAMGIPNVLSQVAVAVSEKKRDRRAMLQVVEYRLP